MCNIIIYNNSCCQCDFGCKLEERGKPVNLEGIKVNARSHQTWLADQERPVSVLSQCYIHNVGVLQCDLSILQQQYHKGSKCMHHTSYFLSLFCWIFLIQYHFLWVTGARRSLLFILMLSSAGGKTSGLTQQHEPVGRNHTHQQSETRDEFPSVTMIYRRCLVKPRLLHFLHI